LIKPDLRVLGFTAAETKIYLVLLDNPNLSAKEIQSIVGISQAKVYDSLMNLVQGKPGIGGLIDFRTEGKKRIYYPIDPRTNLQQLREDIIATITSETQKAVDEITERYTLSSERGVCTKYSGFRSYRNIDTSLRFMKEVLFTAVDQIVLHSFPAWILKEIRFEINQIAHRTRVKVYISLTGIRDDYIHSLFSPEVEVILSTLPSKVPFFIDDEEWERAEILIDRNRMVGVSYSTEKMDITVTAFSNPVIVLNMLDELSKLENRISLSNQRSDIFIKNENLILSLVKEKPLTKHELALTSGLSGKELNLILDQLCTKGTVRVEKEKVEKGRPRHVVHFIDK